MSSDKPADNWTGDYTSRRAEADDDAAATREVSEALSDGSAEKADRVEPSKTPEPIAQDAPVPAATTGQKSPETDQSAGAAAGAAAAAATASEAKAAHEPQAGAAAQPVKKKHSWYVRLFGGVIWLYEHLPNALIALMARVSIGLVFWMSGRTKVEDGSIFDIKDSTFFLFKEEYNMPIVLSFGDTQFTVPFTDPVTAAYIATAAEHVLPLLLWIGFCTRFAATGLLIMVCVISFWVYPDASIATWALHGLWAAVLLYLMRFGPGALSIDHLLRRRLMDR